MPFIPHTPEDIRRMLDAIGVGAIDDLFDEIPPTLRDAKLIDVPPGMREMEITRHMQARAAQDGHWSNFIGAGAYEHYIPAAVWQIVTRGEYYSAYTPYQAEASQGTLQLLYEYQSMIAGLTGLDAANASLYDGASALAEAVLMAVRLHKSSRRVLLPASVHPHYADTVRTLVSSQGVEVVTLPWCPERGTLRTETLEALVDEHAAALVIPQPNAFGVLEDVHALTDWAHRHAMLAIALVNPVSLALLAAPGKWGAQGADIAVGEGQPLGVPLSAGGPYFGFMTCKIAHVRQMPGRIAGRTLDAVGAPGFTLTLQAREQHIRRSKATSNICTNQGLAVAAATVHMALLGPDGLRRVAEASHAGLQRLLALLRPLGVRPRFSAPCFHECVLDLGAPARAVLESMRERRILGGLDLAPWADELEEALLVCVTETKNDADLDDYAQAMSVALGRDRLKITGAPFTATAPLEQEGVHPMATVTLKGNPVPVAGELPAKGQTASDFTLVNKDLQNVSLTQFAGKRKVLNIVPSLDTPTCQKSTRVFNEKASSMNNTAVLVVAADLPFAMSRFCGAEGLNNVVTLSTMRDHGFHRRYGVDIVGGALEGLTARAVVVLDEHDKVIHSELVPEIAQEPNYDAALAALK